MIERLHRLGVKLALDDFGTEHSSLSRLRALPGAGAQGRPLVPARRARRRRVGAAIVRAIATLGAGLGMDVVAEGIETAEQLRFAADGGLRLRPGLPLRPAAAGRRRSTRAAHIVVWRRHAEQSERPRDDALRRRR